MMIFSRKIEATLYEWKAKHNRKPLILRGARQVGKSTLIKKMGRTYTHFISLNLEKPNDKKYFLKERDVKEIWQQLIFEKKSQQFFALIVVGQMPPFWTVIPACPLI